MRFQHTAKVSHPPSAVLDLLMNRMQEIVPFLLNVERIDVQEHRDMPEGRFRVVSQWHATEKSIPLPIRPFLSKELISWIDDALWTPAEHKVDWEMSTKFSEFFHAAGTNYYEPTDGGTATDITIGGNLTVYPDRLPGMPAFLAERLKPQVERFVIELIAPNLTDVAMGLQEYLDQHKRP
jgi:hypothetical protein